MLMGHIPADPPNSLLFPSQARGNDSFTISLMHFDVPQGLVDSAYGHPKRSWIPAGAGAAAGWNVGFLNHSYGFGGANTQWIITARTLDLDFPGDFTVDFWFQSTLSAQTAGVVGRTDNTSPYSPWLFLINNDNTMQFYSTSAAGAWDISNGATGQNGNMGACAVNEWHHWAAVRKDNTMYLFRDGSLVRSFGVTPGLRPWLNAMPLAVGAYNANASNVLSGRVDELRVSSIARWTANFTLSRENYYTILSGGNDDATKLLMHLNHSTIDNAKAPGFTLNDPIPSPHIFNQNGAATFAGTAGDSRIGLDVLSCNGSANCRLVTNAGVNDCDPGYGNFTIDCWYYKQASVAADIVGKRDITSAMAPWCIYDDGTGKIGAAFSQSGSAFDVVLDLGAIPNTTWTHIAIVRNGSTITGYINGVQKAQNTAVGIYLWYNGGVISIGGDSNVSTNALVDEVRFSNVARWLGPFTPKAPGTDVGYGPDPLIQPAATFTVTAPASCNINQPFNVTVQARDINGATTTNYTGTVHFTSTDGAAVLPANTTLVNGTGTFSVTIKTAGTQYVGATDTVTSTITGTSGPITVNTYTSGVVFLGALSGSWTVPAGFNPGNNFIDCIGGGGGGGTLVPGPQQGGGGGGGGYVRYYNLGVVAGNVVSYVCGAGGAGGPTATGVGQAGGDTWFYSPGVINAKGGGGGAGAGGQGGGLSGGNVTNGPSYGGGSGEAGGIGAGGVAGGGGGAGGPYGPGGNGGGGYGGTGGNGSGGAGAYGGATGGTGNEYGSNIGSGGGGGGFNGGIGDVSGGVGGAYGGGGGGGHTYYGGDVGGQGQQGVIIVVWNP